MNSEEKHQTHVHNHSGSGVPSLILGVAVGAAITYLLTNKEGQKIRDTLLKEGTKLLDEITKTAQDVSQSLQYNNVKEELSERIEEVKKSVEQIESIVEDVPHHIEQIQKKGRRFFFKKPAAES